MLAPAAVKPLVSTSAAGGLSNGARDPSEPENPAEKGRRDGSAGCAATCLIPVDRESPFSPLPSVGYCAAPSVDVPLKPQLSFSDGFLVAAAAAQGPRPKDARQQPAGHSLLFYIFRPGIRRVPPQSW